MALTKEGCRLFFHLLLSSLAPQNVSSCVFPTAKSSVHPCGASVYSAKWGKLAVSGSFSHPQAKRHSRLPALSSASPGLQGLRGSGHVKEAEQKQLNTKNDEKMLSLDP